MTIAYAIALSLLVASVLFTLVALVVPVGVRFSAEGRGDPSGRWALAGGASISFVSIAFVTARGVAPRVHTQIARWSFGPWSLAALLVRFRRKSPQNEPARESDDDRFAALTASYDKLARWLDPIDLAIFLVGEKRRVQVGKIDVTTKFGDADVALVGKVTGALHVLGAVLGPRFSITPEPVWTGESLVSFTLAGDVTLRPGFFLVDVLAYLVKNARLLPPPRPLSRAPSETDP